MRCHPACSTTDAALRALASGDVGRDSAIAIGADGNAVIAYTDTTNNDLGVAHCIDTACSAVTTTRHASAGVDGVRPAIVIGADGLPLIVHIDRTAESYIVTHCSSAFCVPHQRSQG